MFDEATVPLTDQIRKVLDDLDRHRVHIEAALAYTGGTHTFDDVVSMVLAGRVRFWPGEHGFLITEIVQYPRQSHYHIWLGGGDGAIQELIALHPQVQQAAREAGCSHMTINGRLGWRRVLADYGWQFYYTALTLEVEA